MEDTIKKLQKKIDELLKLQYDKGEEIRNLASAILCLSQAIITIKETK